MTQRNPLNQQDSDLDEAMDYVQSVAKNGPKTVAILETFEAIENFEVNEVLKLLRAGVCVGSRDRLGYSLLHCSVVFNCTRVANILVSGGAAGVTCGHFTPLNLALMLHYLPRLANKVELCRETVEPAKEFETLRVDKDSAYGSSIFTVSSNDESASQMRPHSGILRR